MSVTYYSYAIIGVEIDKEKLWSKAKAKAYDHDFPETINFDHQTGNKLWVMENNPIEGFDGDDNLLNFMVIYTTNQDRCFLAAITATNDGEASLQPISTQLLADCKARLKETLKPLGLWNEEKFGLWAVQHCNRILSLP